MYKCPLCTKTFKNPTILNNHMFSHTKEKPYKCLKCPGAFRWKYYLKYHMKAVHDGIKDMKKKNHHCALCSFKCSSKTHLEIHSRKHSAELPFSCSIAGCGYKTKYKHCLRQHICEVHNDKRPYACPSDGCNHRAKSIRTLKAHLAIHSNDRPFTCQIPGCQYSCKRKPDLKKHNFAVHSDGKLLSCSDCDFQTKYRSNLRQHRHTHANVKRFQCRAPNCGFASPQKSTVEAHFDSKHRKKNIKCTAPGCNRQFGSINLLKRHLRVHKSPTLKCPDECCNFSTKVKRSLLKHIHDKHTNLQLVCAMIPRKLGAEVSETPGAEGTIHCYFPTCGYQTKFSQHYDRHILSHNEGEERKHVCTFCFYRFKHFFQLQRHIQRHTGEKPYRCPFCEYKIGSSSELRYHAGKIHHIHVIPRGLEEENIDCSTCNVTLSSYTEFVLHSMTHLKPVVVLERLRVHVD